MTTHHPIGAVTEQGPPRLLCADAHATHIYNDTLAAVVIDGTGSTPEVADFAAKAAWAAARVAARHDDPGYAILYAAELNADPDAGRDAPLPEPDGAIVVATADPKTGWRIATAGDCKAFTFDGHRVQRLTEDHTVGALLRRLGVSDEVAGSHDCQLMHSLGRARPGTVPAARTKDRVVVLGSDGLKLSEKQILKILLDHAADPAAAAHDLVAAAREHTTDDITALVALRPTP